jgi:hypothetical protein
VLTYRNARCCGEERCDREARKKRAADLKAQGRKRAERDSRISKRTLVVRQRTLSEFVKKSSDEEASGSGETEGVGGSLSVEVLHQSLRVRAHTNTCDCGHNERKWVPGCTFCGWCCVSCCAYSVSVPRCCISAVPVLAALLVPCIYYCLLFYYRNGLCIDRPNYSEAVRKRKNTKNDGQTQRSGGKKQSNYNWAGEGSKVEAK